MALGDRYYVDDQFLEEIRRIRSDIRRLQEITAKNNTANHFAEFPYFAFGKISEDCSARTEDDFGVGKFYQWSYNTLEKEVRESLNQYEIRNPRFSKIEEGTEITAAYDGRDWLIIDVGAETSFFRTGSAGIPAASNLLIPGKAENVARYKFDIDTETLDIYRDAENNPVSDTVYNIAGEAVGGDLIIQAKKIDGAWFVDVEPCTRPPG